MLLNKGFNKKIEPIINSSDELLNWFDINQDLMTFYKLDHPGCLQYESYKIADEDIKVLGRMANHCLTVLELYDCSYQDKIVQAIKGMFIIYQLNKDNLSDIAKNRLYINPINLPRLNHIKNNLEKYYGRQI